MHLFDQGWNQLRETIFANQKKLGGVTLNLAFELIGQWGELFAADGSGGARRTDGTVCLLGRC